MTVDSIADGVFGHDEADITIISYMLQAADDGCHVVGVLRDDTDIFALLVYWTWLCDLQNRLAVQMKKWDGVVLDVNATCAHLGSTVSSQLLGSHAIAGCVTVSYPFDKGKASMIMLNTLKEGDFPGLFDMHGEEGASQEDIMAVGEQFFVALYGYPSSSSMTPASYNFYSRNQGKTMRIISLPPTYLTIFLDVKRAHLHNYATVEGSRPDQLGPPDVSITEYGWEIQDGLICPSIFSGPPGPPLQMNAICCRCHAECKACKEANCSGHRVKLSSIYCLYSAGEACHSPFTKKDDEMEDEAPHTYEHQHDNDRDEQDEYED